MSQNLHKIEIADQQHRRFDSQRLVDAVKIILVDHAVKRSEISIAIVDDPTIRQLNRQYLDHDYETDVISFVLDADDESAYLCGQLIVSTDTAADQAQTFCCPMQDELLLYVVHGTLHLVGYDDKQTKAAKEMRLAERKYLAKFGVEHRWSLPNPGPRNSQKDCGVDS